MPPPLPKQPSCRVSLTSSALVRRFVRGVQDAAKTEALFGVKITTYDVSQGIARYCKKYGIVTNHGFYGVLAVPLGWCLEL